MLFRSICFTLIIQPTATLFSFYLLQTNILLFPHYTSNSLFSARPVRLTTSLFRWGQSILVVLCAGSTLLLTPVVRPANVSGINLQKCFLPPTGRFNLGFLLRENLLLCSSYLPLGVSQYSFIKEPSKIFRRRCRGGRSFLQGESLTLNLFTLFLFCFS